MAHMHTTVSVQGEKRSQEQVVPPFLVFFLVLQMKPKLTFTAPAEYKLIISLV